MGGETILVAWVIPMVGTLSTWVAYGIEQPHRHITAVQHQGLKLGETAGLVPERYWRVLSHHQSGITSLWVELLPSFRKSWQQTAAIWLLWIPMCLYRLSYYHCLVLWFSFSGQATIAGLEGSGDIVSVSCTENEIFFLKGDRNIIRISSRPEGLASVGLYLL